MTTNNQTNLNGPISANKVFSGPTSGGATAPAFRSLVTADYAVTGTFTPTLTGSSANPTSITYSVQQGRWTRIGDLVFYNISVQVSALTIGAAAGNLQITGLPQNSAFASSVLSSVSLQNVTFSGNTVGYMTAGSNLMTVLAYTSGAGWNQIAITAITSTTGIIVSGLYFDNAL